MAIPKVGKPPSTLQAWRSIALHEIACKGIGKAVRRRLTDFLAAYAMRGHGSQKGQSLGVPSQYVRSYLQMLNLQRKSGGILYVDGRDAYYSVLKQQLQGNFLDSEADLIKLADSLAISEEHRLEVLVALAGPGALEEAGAPFEVRHVVRTLLQDTWFTMDVSESRAQKPSSGLVPGTPIADVLYQYVQAKCLRKIQHQLWEDGLLAQASPDGERAPAAGWADDLAFFLPAGPADQVVDALTCVARLVDKECRSTGVALNYGPGKTEAMIVLHGPESRRLKHELLRTPEPSIKVQLTPQHAVDLRLVHAEEGSGYGRNIRRLKATLLRNAALDETEKLTLLRRLVVARFCFGAGRWTLRTQVERAFYKKTLMRYYRQSSRLIKGFSTKLLCDSDVCKGLGVLEPEAVLAVEQTRQLAVVALHGHGFLWEATIAAKHWLSDAVGSLGWILSCLGISWQVPSDPQACLAFLEHKLKDASAMLRRFVRIQLADQVAEGRHIVSEAKAWEALERNGGAVLPVPTVIEQGADPLLRELCGRGFRSRAGLSGHMAKTHGVRSELAVIGGSACAVCGRDFWTTPRLVEHVRHSATCRAVYTQADLDIAMPHERVGDRNARAWQQRAAARMDPLHA